MKKPVTLSFLLFLFVFANAQLQSPEQFLGYKIGARYTPHWRIVEYFRHVAAQKQDMVKLQPYGQTNEGRPLMVAYISAPAHISNLEGVRTNNLRLAATENTAGNTNGAPALVWLSYNVHGNETSSSEAAMMTLYALVDPANTRTKQWLQNTVIVMDPCLNPDGRDRYVNWFNSVVGRQYNPVLEAREHREPWPGGRSNHYNFDLNRDWAWQTQLESQQRVKLFNQWLPQIHVDFHEQGINQPYYFAPAAQPYHEVITPWQRSFQETIGRNHARYFDEKGWLYFTKEVFDLLYPSYGDTYPIYNGAIGMTYEQGGGSAAGLGVLTDEGDTLTLTDRALHHFTTGLSTVEVASQHAARLLNEFQSFHRNAANNGVGDYKSYVIKHTPQDASRIQALKTLLDKNGIRYGAGRSSSLRGYNFNNGKEESFSVTAADLVVPATQSKGTLVNVLFEPRTTVVDSNTYDITAWAMPYAYGLKAFASRTPVAFDAAAADVTIKNATADPYAYVIRWNGVNSVKLATQLMQRGIRLRTSETPFTIGNEQFERGAIVVMKTSNQYIPDLWNTVRVLADSARVQLTPVATGFVDKGSDFGSSKVLPLKARRVALLTGEGTSSLGAGEIWHFFDQVLEYPVTLISQADLSRFNWHDYDVVIMPDGAYRFLSDKAAAEQLRNWIAAGGNLVALENAVAQLSRLDWSIKQKKDDTASDKDSPYAALSRFENKERDFIQNITPGSIYKVELDNTHPLAFGYPEYYYTLKQDDRIYEFISEGGWNVGVLKKSGQISGFVGNKLTKRLQDGLLFGTQNIGRGTVSYLADNPLFRSFWENGKLMFCNAVFLVGQ